MELFLDSAQIEEIQKAVNYNLIDGITSNPSLIKKAAEKHKGIKIDEYIDTILSVAGKRPVSLEVECCTAVDMYKQAKNLWKRFSKKTNNVVIKIPIDPSINDQELEFEGLKVIRKLADEGIPVNVTLIFTPEQALLAAKAGATYVSPFCGRLDDKIRKDHNIAFEKTDYFPSYGWNDNGHILEDNGIISGVDLVKKCVEILKPYKTKVLAASIRSPRQVREVALAGADVATISYSILQQLSSHPKTHEGMEKFVKDTPTEYEALLNGRSGKVTRK